MPTGVYDRKKSNWKAWNKGLTKEIDVRIYRASIKICEDTIKN